MWKTLNVTKMKTKTNPQKEQHTFWLYTAAQIILRASSPFSLVFGPEYLPPPRDSEGTRCLSLLNSRAGMPKLRPSVFYFLTFMGYFVTSRKITSIYFSAYPAR